MITIAAGVPKKDGLMPIAFVRLGLLSLSLSLLLFLPCFFLCLVAVTDFFISL